VLVVAPSLDWHFPQAEGGRVVDTAKGAYRLPNAADNLAFYRPKCLAEFNNDIQSHVVEFLSKP
jgi:hypothetical protein